MQPISLTKATPYQPAAAQDTNLLPPEFTNHRFVYVHYPAGFSWVDGEGFLPDLSAIIAQPGVNGVDQSGKLNKPMSGAIEKGGIVIQTGDPRLGPWSSFIGSYPTRNGGKHWCFIAQTFTILPGGNVKTKDDSAKFIQFRKHLLNSGICHPLDESVFNEKIEVENRTIERLARQAADNPHKAGVYQMRLARRDAMLAWWREKNAALEPVGEITGAAPSDPVSGDEMPAPKPRGRKIEVQS